MRWETTHCIAFPPRPAAPALLAPALDRVELHAGRRVGGLRIVAAVASPSGRPRGLQGRGVARPRAAILRPASEATKASAGGAAFYVKRGERSRVAIEAVDWAQSGAAVSALCRGRRAARPYHVYRWEIMPVGWARVTLCLLVNSESSPYPPPSRGVLWSGDFGK